MADWDCEGDKHADKLCAAVWAASPRWSAERAERGGAGLVSFHMVGFAATSLKMTLEMVYEWEIKSQLKGSSSRRSPCTQSWKKSCLGLLPQLNKSRPHEERSSHWILNKVNACSVSAWPSLFDSETHNTLCHSITQLFISQLRCFIIENCYGSSKKAARLDIKVTALLQLWYCFQTSVIVDSNKKKRDNDLFDI